MTDIRIYNGNRIGGCITVISTETTKIVIDFGEALPGAEVEENIVFAWEQEKVDAVFFTHYHGDHIGRFMEIPEDVPLYMGEVTYKVLQNFYGAIHRKDALAALAGRENIHYIAPNDPVMVGDITVTPYSVDHSAFDAYMFLVTTPDRNILHTGDYRDHGHRGHKTGKNGEDRNVILEVIHHYVLDHGTRKIDTLITEGTMLGARSAEKRYSERDLYRDARDFFKTHKYIFLKISSTNADSLASFYHAAVENGMGFYANKYVIKQLETFREGGKKYTDYYNFQKIWPILPAPGEKDSGKFLHSFKAQRKHMREEGFVLVVSEYEYYENIMAEFADLSPVMIYSLWQGYVDESIGGAAYNPRLAEFVKKYHAISMHTGGHAYPELIEAVEQEVGAKEVIVVHTDRKIKAD